MANIAVLGLGNWDNHRQVVALEGHNVTGWTIEQEVYESITMNDVNEKYLPGHSVAGLDATMHLSGALEDAKSSLPSHHPLFWTCGRPASSSSTWACPLDLAKGLFELIDFLIQATKEEGKTNPLAVLTGPTIAPEAAGGVMTTALVASEEQAIAQSCPDIEHAVILHPASDPRVLNCGVPTRTSLLLPVDWLTASSKSVIWVVTT